MSMTLQSTVIPMIHNRQFNVYIASCSTDGGLYHYHLHSDGSLKYVSKTDLDRPMYMKISDKKMYALLRAPFSENEDSALIAYDIDDDGILINPSSQVSTRGKVACHLCVKDNVVYCANYISGSVMKFPDTLVTHRGEGVHPVRQASPHTHYVGVTPDEKFLCVTDLGTDTVYIYTPDMKLVSKASVPKGHGVRHLIFSEDGKYCFSANELMSTASSFLYENGKLTYIETINIIPYLDDSLVK